MVSNTEIPFFVIRRVRILLARLWSSARSVDETHFVTKLGGRNRRKHSCFTVTLLQVVAWHKRLGAGKCRHIEVKWLWLQQAMDEKKLATKHVPTESNIADIGTKGLTSNRKRELLNQMGEFGSRCGVSCAAANGENHVDVHY